MDKRDEKGRFAVGNPGGPGRPPRATERDYLEALTDIITPERWRAICERAARDAENGDAKAREWVARYLIGSGDSTVWAKRSYIASGSYIEALLDPFRVRKDA